MKQEEFKYPLGQVYSARKQQRARIQTWVVLTPPLCPSKVLNEQKGRQNSVMNSHMLVI